MKFKVHQIIPVFFMGFILFAFLYSCRHDAEDLDLFPEICFENQVLPVFQSSCAISGCHDRPGGESNYVFNSYSGIIQAIEPGSPEKSPAYTSLSSIWGENFMPPDQPLSKENRTIIRLWIQQGARNTSCPDSIPPDDSVYVNPRACFGRDIFPFIQSNCATSGCHDDITAEEGYSFTSYQGILEAVSPGNPGNSKLYESITSNETEDKMPPPPRDPLPGAVIDSIYSWISYGAPDEDCGEVCDTTSVVNYADVIWPLISKNCLGCHSGTSPSGNTLLETYSDIASLASSGKLSGVLRGRGQNVQMPPAGPLPECKIRQVEIWIDNGFPQ